MRHTRFAKGFQRGRKKGQNDTEAAYSLWLDKRIADGEVLDYWFEGITLKLADATRYTPDFLVMVADGGLELHEVKAGRMDKETGAVVPMSEDASRVKLNIAAERFPFRFRLAFVHRHQWHFREVGA